MSLPEICCPLKSFLNMFASRLYFSIMTLIYSMLFSSSYLELFIRLNQEKIRYLRRYA